MEDLRGTPPEDLYELDFPVVPDRPRPRKRTPVEVKQSDPMRAGKVAVAIVVAAALFFIGMRIGTATQQDEIADALSTVRSLETSAAINRTYAGSLETSVTKLTKRADRLTSELASATDEVEMWQQRYENAAITIDSLELEASKLKQQKAAPAPKKPSPIKTSYSTKGVEQWRPLVAKYFKAANVDAALSVMRKESGGNPAATNKSSGCAGLFQIHPCHAAKFKARTGTSDMHDPEANIRFAAYMSNYGRDWSAWVAQP